MPVTALGDPLSAGDISRPQDRYTVGGKGKKTPANMCWGDSPTALGILQNSQVLGISINTVSPLVKYRGTQCIY